MSDDKRLSVSFGAFSCEIIGYEDPVSVLNRTVAALQAAADANPGLGQSEEIGDLERARITAALAADAAEVDVEGDGAHLVLTRGDDGAFDEDEAPRRKPLNIAPPPETPQPAAGSFAGADMTEAAGPETEAEPQPAAAEAVQPRPAVAEPPRPVTTEAPEPADTAIPAAPEPAAAEAPQPVMAEAPKPVTAEAPQPVTEYESRPEMEETPRPAMDEAPQPAPPSPAMEETREQAIPAPTDMEAALVEEPAPFAAEAAAHETAGAWTPATDEAPVPDAIPVTPPADDRPSLEERIAAYTSQIGTAPPPSQPTAEEAPNMAAPQPVAETAPVPPPDEEREAETPAADIAAPPRHTADIVEAFPKAREALEPNEEEIVRLAAERMADDDLGVDDQPKSPDGLENVLRSIDKLNGGGDARKPVFLSESEASLDPDENDDGDDDGGPKPRRNFAAFLRRGISARKKQEEVDLEAAAAIGFERLKKTAQEQVELDDWDDVPSTPIAERQIRAVGAEALHSGVSPTRFAEYVRAASLHDLLEASAVYLALVDGKPRFSRRDVMVALSQIGDDRGYPQQARLKSFRKLLTSGAIVRVDDGMYAVAESTWKGYRQKLVG